VVGCPMILCVTLNPCLDKTLTVPPWRPGDNVRGVSLREVVGGKGNNVARALARLGRAARPVTFLGGPVGAYCELLLRRDDGLDPVVTPSAAATRVITTIKAEGDAPPDTAFFDPDPAITQEESDALFKKVEEVLAAGGVEAITLSGSSPNATTHGLFSDLISLARAKRVAVFLDTYGPALDAIWGFWPDVMQLNRREAAGFLRQPNPTDADILAMLDKWARHGVKVGVVTDGADPVLARVGGQKFRLTPPEIKPVNPIGSGDCLLAGLVAGHLAGLEPEALLRQAVGSAVSNALVWDAGAISPDAVKQQAEAVEVEAI
jgi:tagatose 6-phosphate kinase